MMAFSMMVQISTFPRLKKLRHRSIGDRYSLFRQSVCVPGSVSECGGVGSDRMFFCVCARVSVSVCLSPERAKRPHVVVFVFFFFLCQLQRSPLLPFLDKINFSNLHIIIIIVVIINFFFFSLLRTSSSSVVNSAYFHW
mgnify:CR=1 FL=1